MTPEPIIANSIILNAPSIGTTTTDSFATPIHRVPLVVPGRYSNAATKALVDVELVDAQGVHYYHLTNNADDPSIVEKDAERKLMNTHVFALSHHPL